MFGKKSKMSTNDRAVMAMGRANGNLVSGKEGKTYGNTRGPDNRKRGKETPDPYKPRTLKVGKNSGFSVE